MSTCPSGRPGAGNSSARGIRSMVCVSSGLIWMNMEERQPPLQAPQGTSAPPCPDRKEASVLRSHSEKLPAGALWLLIQSAAPLGRRRSLKNVIKEVTMKQPTTAGRRDFFKATTGAAGTALPAIISAQTVTNAIKVGLVGCGGRGTGAASQALAADDLSELTAMADIDQGNIDKSMAALARIAKTS